MQTNIEGVKMVNNNLRCLKQILPISLHLLGFFSLVNKKYACRMKSGFAFPDTKTIVGWNVTECTQFTKESEKRCLGLIK